MEDKLSKRYIIKLISNVTSTLVGIGFISLVPSNLGPIVYGQFTYLQRFFNYLFGFLDFGTSIAFFTKISSNPNRKELILFSLIISVFILILGSAIISVIFVFDIHSKIFPNYSFYLVILGMIYVFLTWFSLLFVKTADAYAETFSSEVVKIIYKIVSFFILILIISYDYLDLIAFLWFHILLLLLYIILMIYVLHRKKILNFKIKILNGFQLKSLIYEFKSYCNPLIVHSIFFLGVNVFDLWVLQVISGSTEVGFYGLAYQIGAVGFMFTNALTPIITREFSKYYELKDFNRIRTIFLKFIPMFFSMALLFAVFTFYQAENLIYLFTDLRYLNAKNAIILMGFYFVFHVQYKLIGTLLFSFQRTKSYRDIGIFYMVFGFLLTILLVYFYDLGATGLALKMLLSQFLGSLITIIYTAKLIDIQVISQFKNQIISLFFILLIGYFSHQISLYFDNYFKQTVLFSITFSFLTILTFYFFPLIFGFNKYEVKLFLMKLKK